MKAVWNEQILAEADQKDLIRIEGGWYFPPESINKEFLKENDSHTTCFWKGEASYYTIQVDGKENPDAAFRYSKPMDGSIDRVGKDFTDYVSFWHGVEVTE
jgi:uncharacterized protein (DUF427 family)